MTHELPIPAFIPDDTVEFVRIFRNPDGSLFFMVKRPEEDEADPAFWGIVAVDLLHHAANHEEGRGLSTDDGPCTVEAIRDRIREIFDSEWKDRTDTVVRLTDG